MDEALRERIGEIHRLRQEYDDLYEQSRQAHALHLEREELLKGQLQKQQEVIQILQDKNIQLKDVLRLQLDWKEQVIQEMKESQSLIVTLSMTKDNLETQYHDLQRQYYHVKKEKEEALQVVEDLQVQQITLSQQIHEYSLQQMEFDTIQKKYNALQHIVEYDMIAKIQYDSILYERDFLLQKVENDLIHKDVFLEEKQAKEQLQQQLQDEYIVKTAFDELQVKYDQLLEEKQVLESTFKVMEETRDERLKTSAEYEGVVKSLTQQVHEKDIQIRQFEDKTDALTTEITEIKAELQRVYDDLHRQHQYTAQYETNKASFTTQIGNLKLQLRREQDAKLALQEQNHVLVQKMDEQKTEYSKSLLENQQKLQEVNQVKDIQYQEKIHALEVALQEEQQKKYDMQGMQEECMELEQEVQQHKTNAAIQHAYQENYLKEISDCKNVIIGLQEEKALLQQKNEDLQHVIEDFRMAIMTELSPSFKHFYVKPQLLTSSPGFGSAQGSSAYYQSGLHNSGVGRQLSSDELEATPFSPPPPPPQLSDPSRLPQSLAMSNKASPSMNAVAARSPSPVVKDTAPSNTTAGPTSHISNPNAIQLHSQEAKLISKSPSPMGRNGGVVINTEPGGKLIIDPSLPSLSLPRTNTTPTRLRPVSQLSNGAKNNGGSPTNTGKNSNTVVIAEPPSSRGDTSPKNSSSSGRGRFQQVGAMETWRSPTKPSALQSKQQSFAMTKHVVPRVRITASSSASRGSMDSQDDHRTYEVGRDLKIQGIELSPSADLKSSSSSPSSSAISLGESPGSRR